MVDPEGRFGRFPSRTGLFEIDDLRDQKIDRILRQPRNSIRPSSTVFCVSARKFPTITWHSPLKDWLQTVQVTAPLTRGSGSAAAVTME
ncbi:hypothetical protein VTN00DRAFT_6502 [Thermoascus crustaceus]|uniref:uncharacterized protein n=1 Tax=Thermoascus crustaceus TaxID=5088 RepID=UPI003742A17B